MKHWRKLIPVAGSAALISWVVYQVSPSELRAATTVVQWEYLLPLTAGLVLALYLWDAICLRWLFSRPGVPLPYGTALYARGFSYLASAINDELGQGLLAWMLAGRQRLTLLAALGRCVLLAGHDIVVLLTFGLVGALLSTAELAPALRLFCGLGLAGSVALVLVIAYWPGEWRLAWRASRWGAGWEDWSLGRSCGLFLLRGLYYSLLLVYAAAGLTLCGVSPDYRVIFSTVPLVLLADGLPISLSGLGTRETALLFLLRPDPPGPVVAFSLIWSTGVLAGRALLGLGHWWGPSVWRRRGAAAERNPDDSPGDGREWSGGKPPG